MAEEPTLPARSGKSRPKSASRLEVEMRVKAARDRSYSHRKLTLAFLAQHADDRAHRGRYARLLIRLLIAQAVFVNLLVVGLGLGPRIGFDLDPWTARSFVVTVFAEICVLVAIVARYLFAPSFDHILDVLDRFREFDPPEAD